MRFVARLTNLVRGTLGLWLRGRERKNPEAVYEAAIQERLEQYGKLREAAAGVLYMRSKLAKELDLKSAEVKRLRSDLDAAVERDDDEAALALITRRDVLSNDVDRIGAELAELTEEAEAAKKNLRAFQEEIVRLREEKTRMLARLANAKARLRLQETFAGFSPDADIRALESVREHIQRLVEEVRLHREVGDGELERRLGKIREAEATAAARSQLREMKRSRRAGLVPMVIPEAERTEARAAGA